MPSCSQNISEINLKGAWHTVYAMLLSNYKWDATWNSYNEKVLFSQTYNSFSNDLLLCWEWNGSLQFEISYGEWVCFAVFIFASLSVEKYFVYPEELQKKNSWSLFDQFISDFEQLSKIVGQLCFIIDLFIGQKKNIPQGKQHARANTQGGWKLDIQLGHWLRVHT